ncbi:hypothetical protein pb186bvf_011086 [Paramecium bursaria]
MNTIQRFICSVYFLLFRKLNHELIWYYYQASQNLVIIFQKINVQNLDKNSTNFQVYQNRNNAPQAYDDAICSICEVKEDYVDNQIVFCDGCDVAVHMSCYQMGKIDMNREWLCQSCNSLKQNICYFCPETHLALQSFIINGKEYWVFNLHQLKAHTVCLKWHPKLLQVKYTSNEYKQDGPIQNPNIKCYYCEGQEGFKVKCSIVGCKEYFHVGCLKNRGGVPKQDLRMIANDFFQPYVKGNEQHLYCRHHYDDMDQKGILKEVIQSMNDNYETYYQFNNLSQAKPIPYYPPQKKQKEKKVQNEQKEQKEQKEQLEKKDQKNGSTRKRKKPQRHQSPISDPLLQRPAFQSIKNHIHNKKDLDRLKQNFQDSRLDRLEYYKNKFYQLNKQPDQDDEEDTYIQLDIELSKKLFDQIVDINNLEAFDAYLIRYFLFHNLMDKVDNPRISIKNDSYQSKYWFQVLKDIGVKNGENLYTFINQLRFKKAHLVSRANLKEQNVNQLLEFLGEDVNIQIID